MEVAESQAGPSQSLGGSHTLTWEAGVSYGGDFSTSEDSMLEIIL